MREDPRVEKWMGGLKPADRIITCTIVLGEILFGIRRLQEGKRRVELEEKGYRILDSFYCEAVPSKAGDFYASVKVSRQRSGLTLDENDLWVAATALALSANLVTRDRDFAGIDGLNIVSPE